MTDDLTPDPTDNDLPVVDGDAPDEPPPPDDPQTDDSPKNDPVPEESSAPE